VTEPTPPPAETPAEPAPTTSTPARDSGSGGSPLALIALVGALIVIGATFAPWLGQGGDGVFSDSRVELSGWDFYDDRDRLAEEPNSFYLEESFLEDDAPFFNGLSTVIAGAAVGIVAIGLLAMRGRSSGLDALLAFLALAAAVLVLVVCFTNLISYLRAGDENLAGLKWGLLLIWIGAFLGAAVLPAALAGGRADTSEE